MPKGYTILVVDDDPIVLRGAARMLRNHWDVMAVDSVPEAIAKMREGGTSVVLTDWNMDHGGGEAVCDEALALGIPVVVNSAGGWQKGMEKAHSFIPKLSSLVDIDRTLWDAIKSV